MRSRLRRCPECGTYTLLESCKACGTRTVCPVPPRYSPEDRLGEYRRKAVYEEYGENGKLDIL